MAFKIHPHFGYLNTDILLINSDPSNITVRDKSTDKEYTIPASSNISIRLAAGEHSFVAGDKKQVIETAFIEDAIKLGGSREKKTYIFEGTPWALMVMLDRTYFYNRDTKEQYLEYGLAPETIKFLTPNYLLFVSKTDNSLFSLNNLSIEKTLGDSTFLFSNNHYSIFSCYDGLILYSLDDNLETRLKKLKCTDYAIDDEKQILFYHLEDGKEVLIKQLDDINAKETYYRLKEPFRCFVGCHSIVYGYIPQSLKIEDLQTKESCLLYNDLVPVTLVNGKVIWENNASDLMDEKEVKNSFTSFAELTVFERPGNWLYAVKVNHILKYCGNISNKVNYSVHSTNKSTFIQSDTPLTIIEGKSFDCVTDNFEKGFLVFNKKIREYIGEPLVSPSGYILIATKDQNSTKFLFDPLVPSFKHLSNGFETETLFRKTGLIRVDVNGIVQFRDIANHQFYYNANYEDLGKGGFYQLTGGGGNYIHSRDGHVHAMPCTKERLIAISEQCNYAIIRSEEGFLFYKYDPIKEEWFDTPLGCIQIDESFYSKAIFCSDNDNIIYQKKDDKYYYRQLGSGVEIEFSPEGSIRRNINGYIPFLSFETMRKPVYIDPVTLTRVEGGDVEKFTYQSVDGSIVHISHNAVKYLDNHAKQYVTKETYKSYVEKYDYETEGISSLIKKVGEQYEKVKKNRIVFYNSNKAWLEEILKERFSYKFGIWTPDYLNVFLDITSVCDTIFFTKEYYVREKIRDEVLDIKLPEALSFLNYISYSYDNRFIFISGRFSLNSFRKGLALVYDVKAREIVYMSTSTMAVWLGVFSKTGMVAYYDSTPNTFVADDITDTNKNSDFCEIEGRSFLTFSPSGKYIVLSRQGYIPYVSGNPHWGHQPSRDVYIVKSDSPQHEIAHFFDHGDQIEGTGGCDRTNSSVASATFSKDETKLMTVSKDGVVVIRNLHLD